MSSRKEQLIKAANVVPTPKQLVWQDMEFAAFIHFNMNTFNNCEHGSGREKPSYFHPNDFDAAQWISPIKAAGMKGVILTCKYDDGFCIWQTETTGHSVGSCEWAGGKGDIVRDVARECEKAGLKFGVYLSPYDLHEPSHGKGEEYNEFFKAQLRELLTNYGEIFAVWLERPPALTQDYDWAGYEKLINTLQPEAVVINCGSDVRWVGNHSGLCRKSEWSVVPKKIRDNYATSNIVDPEIGSRKNILRAKELCWYPAVVDIPIRDKWFYHRKDNFNPRRLSKVLDTYFDAVGANANLIVSIPPDPNGVLHKNDVDSLLTLGAQLKIEFKDNLAKNAKITASSEKNKGFCAQNAAKSDDSYWHSGEDVKKAELIIDLGEEKEANKAVFCENTATGQQIEAFSLYYKTNKGKWKKLAKSSVVGHKRICNFNTLHTQFFKLKIEKTRHFATIKNFEVY